MGPPVDRPGARPAGRRRPCGRRRGLGARPQGASGAVHPGGEHSPDGGQHGQPRQGRSPSPRADGRATPGPVDLARRRWGRRIGRQGRGQGLGRGDPRSGQRHRGARRRGRCSGGGPRSERGRLARRLGRPPAPGSGGGRAPPAADRLGAPVARGALGFAHQRQRPRALTAPRTLPAQLGVLPQAGRLGSDRGATCQRRPGAFCHWRPRYPQLRSQSRAGAGLATPPGPTRPPAGPCARPQAAGARAGSGARSPTGCTT